MSVDLKKLKVLAELGEDGCVVNQSVRTDGVKNVVPILEKEQEKGEVGNEKWWEAVYQLEGTHIRTKG